MTTPDAESVLQIARAIGENAPGVFGATLLVLLLIVGAGTRAVRHRYVRRHIAPETADARLLIATCALGFAAIVVMAFLFATLPGRVVDDGAVHLADQALTDAVRRTMSPSMLHAFAAFTVLADRWVQWTFAVAGAMLLLWWRERILACIWIVAIAGNGILTNVLKSVFARARPLHDGELIAVHGYSFPSGHSSGAVVVYGMLAYALCRHTRPALHLPVALVATAIAFSVGCSRVLLQVHYASDVLAGFVSGMAWLAVCIIAAELSRRAGSGTS